MNPNQPQPPNPFNTPPPVNTVPNYSQPGTVQALTRKLNLAIIGLIVIALMLVINTITFVLLYVHINNQPGSIFDKDFAVEVIKSTRSVVECLDDYDADEEKCANKYLDDLVESLEKTD